MLMSAGLLAACGTALPDAETIPTLADFPTAFNLTDVARETGTLVAAQRTLPPTFTPTHTFTPSATHTPTPTAALSATSSLMPSATITDTPSPVPSPLPTIAPEDRPLLGLLQLAIRATVLPDDYQVPDFGGVDVTLAPTVAAGDTIPSLEDLTALAVVPQPDDAGPAPPDLGCAFAPPGSFGTLYANNPDVAQQLGCPIGSPPTAANSQGATQAFERGSLWWVQATNTIYALYNADDTYAQFADTFVPGSDPETSSETPPPGLLAPVRGFLKVWSNEQRVRDGLGWATTAETAVPLTVLNFENGAMLYVTNRNRTLIVIEPTGQYRWFAG